MLHIVPAQDSRSFAEFDGEPPAAELVAIAAEMPVIRAEVELLDVQIALLDRPVSELDARRLRRAENKLLAERARLANAERGVPGVSA